MKVRQQSTEDSPIHKVEDKINNATSPSLITRSRPHSRPKLRCHKRLRHPSRRNKKERHHRERNPSTGTLEHFNNGTHSLHQRTWATQTGKMRTCLRIRYSNPKVDLSAGAVSDHGLVAHKTKTNSARTHPTTGKSESR